MQHRDRQKYAEVAFYSLYENVGSVFNTFLQIYTLLGLALMGFTQFQFKRKHQFHFCVTLK